jgi:hypothetical protein
MDKIEERVAQIEVKTPSLDSRIAKLEQINLDSSFPQSLKTLVSQNLKDKYDDCVKRLNFIENLEIKHNEATLREKMKKLDDLDDYTRK